MKKITSIFAVMFFSFHIFGQNLPKNNEVKSDSVVTHQKRNFTVINPFSDSRDPMPQIGNLHQADDPRDLIFPGASRHYAIWPTWKSAAYDKSSVIKPDTADKYYLIIVDPFNQLVKK